MKIKGSGVIGFFLIAVYCFAGMAWAEVGVTTPRLRSGPTWP